jgi:hypothetical protein
MGRVEASLKGRARDRSSSPKVGEAELRALFDEVLADVDADERAGSLLRAAGLRVRFRFPDLGMVLNVAPSDEAEHHLRWRFSDAKGWEPKLDLVMDSQVANAYFQGRESLAVAMARGKVRARGDTRCALLYVPALRFVVDSYRRHVSAGHPHLAV